MKIPVVALPREHGAYAQLALPLFTALVSARPTLAAWAMTVSAVFAFIAHESLSMLARGLRGRARALPALLLLGVAATVTGLFGFVMAPLAARWAVALPLSLSVALVILVLRRSERTLGGELLASAALAAVAVPVACASGVSGWAAITAFGVWTAVFASATLIARALVRKREAHLAVTVTALGVPLIVASGSLFLLGIVPLAVPLALLPTCLMCVALALLRPSPKRIHTVGWALAASSISTSLVLSLCLAH